MSQVKLAAQRAPFGQGTGFSTIVKLPRAIVGFSLRDSRLLFGRAFPQPR